MSYHDSLLYLVTVPEKSRKTREKRNEKITNSHVSKYQILTRDLQFKTILRIAFHLQFDIMLILNYYDVFRSNLMNVF